MNSQYPNRTVATEAAAFVAAACLSSAELFDIAVYLLLFCSTTSA